MSLTSDYSGVVIDQNGAVSGSFLLESSWHYQPFYLPQRYRRGVGPQTRIPELSGLQVLVKIPEGEADIASLNYTLEYDEIGVGWIPLLEDTVVGSHADGEQVWIDIFFTHPVPVPAALLESQFRFGIRKAAGVEQAWLTSGKEGTGAPLETSPFLETSPTLETSSGATIASEGILNYRVLALVADSGVDFLGNSYRSVAISSLISDTSTTEGRKTGYWKSAPQPSQFAVVSNYFDVRDASNNPVVVDGIMLDPQTPNVAFNVYFSTDGEADNNTSTAEWENKLWSHVPKSFIATQRQNYVFPEPVVASYIQIEYSYLQPQSYNPGDFQTPVTYKKHPKWVADYFISQMKLPTFIANTVGVTYDALDFAYSYYLDDLGQRPAPPAITSPGQSFVEGNNLGQVDPKTLEQINLNLNTYTNPPALRANPDTLLGHHASLEAFSQENYPVERNPIQRVGSLLNVSSIDRASIVFEQSMPVMYFYLKCRHAYKELSAAFDHNRAYFVGVNEVAFLRNNYMTAFDGELYVEAGGDDLNVNRNDFVINDNQSWTTY